jgi:serine/threonine-protein kinase
VKSVLQQHLSEDLSPVVLLRPEVSKPVATALDRLLSKEPADRYPTAVEFMEALGTGSATSEVAGIRPELALRVLGSVDLRGRDGGEIDSILSQPKRLALLAYLGVATPRGFHRRDKLLGLFWPNLDREHARAALRNALYVLRQELGEEILVGRGDEEVGLDFDRVWCDAAECEEALDRGELSQGLDLYRGQLLEGFFLSDVPEFERWLEERRFALAAKALKASQGLARHAEEAADLKEALRWTRRAMELDPLQERSVRQLMGLLDRLGDRSSAIQVYNRFSERLKVELEARPAPETMALVEEIRSREQEQNSRDEVAVGPASPLAKGVEIPIPSTPQEPAPATDSGRRVRTATVLVWLTVAGVLIAGGITLDRLGPGGSSLDNQLVAVLPFENRTGDPGLDDVLGLAAEVATRQIAQGSGLQVVAPVTVEAVLERVEEFQGDPTEAVAALAGAGIVVTGSVHARRDSLVFEGQILNASENRTLYLMRPAQSSDDDPDAAVRALVDQITATLAQHAEFGEALIGRQPPPSLAAYREYRKGLEKLNWPDREDFGGALTALEHFKRAAEMDSTYPAPLLSQLRMQYDVGTASQLAAADSVLAQLELMRAQLTPSEEAYLDLWAGVIGGDYDAAATAATRGFAIDPPSIAFSAGYVEMLRNRPKSALDYFEHADTVRAAFYPVRDYSFLPFFRSRALHMLGRHEEEMAVALDARQRFPDDTQIRWRELSARVALGQAAEVERLIEEGLNSGDEEILYIARGEFQAHGMEDRAVVAAERLLDIYQNHCSPRRTREYCDRRSSDLLVFLGRSEEAVVIIRQSTLNPFESAIAEGLPVRAGLLRRAGYGAALAGDSALASIADSMLAARDDLYLDWRNTHWRAFIAAFSGRPDDAVALLRQAMEEGLPMSLSFHLSVYYEPLRGHPGFEQLIQPKG